MQRTFDDVVAAPMPQTMIDLCDALEDAFRSGLLHRGCDRKRSV